MTKKKLNDDQIAYLNELEGLDRLTPSDLVEAARDPHNPFHASFEWDKNKAAQKHNEWQARQLIKSYRIVVQIEKVPVVIKGFVHDPRAGDDQGYVSVRTISTRPNDAKAAVVTRLKRIRSELEDVMNMAALSKLKVDDLRDALAAITRQLAVFAPKKRRSKAKGGDEHRPTA